MHYPPALIYLFIFKSLAYELSRFLWTGGRTIRFLDKKKNTTDLIFTPLSHKAEEITI